MRLPLLTLLCFLLTTRYTFASPALVANPEALANAESIPNSEAVHFTPPHGGSMPAHQMAATKGKVMIKYGMIPKALLGKDCVT